MVVQFVFRVFLSEDNWRSLKFFVFMFNVVDELLVINLDSVGINDQLFYRIFRIIRNEVNIPIPMQVVYLLRNLQLNVSTLL